MSRLWYYVEGTETCGPITHAELIGILSSLSDARKVLVWRDGFDDWKTSDSVGEIAERLFRPPPLGPRPPPLKQDLPPVHAPINIAQTMPRDRESAGKLNRYRTALYLSIVIALTTFAGWGLIVFRSPQFTMRSITIVSFPFVIAFGLWVQSKFARYVGAVWMVLLAGGLVWSVVSSGTTPLISGPTYFLVLDFFFAMSAILNLLTAWILLFSKQFATEFAYEKQHQPKYKTYLSKLFLAAIVGAMIIATLNDVINLSTQ
jgi:hypothetical protein